MGQFLHHGCIGTEHLLLGLLRLSDCGAVRMLQGAGIDLNDVCTAIMDVFGNPESRGRAQTGALHSPLRRTVRREIIDRAARMLLEGSIQKGDTVEAVCSGEGIELIKTL